MKVKISSISKNFLALTEGVTSAVIAEMKQHGLENMTQDPNMIATLMASSLGMLIGSTTQKTKGSRDEILKSVDRLINEAINTADTIYKD
ncbi:hypothetical protein [Piscirickettsia litoralis]|uniref:hypothetical protein n=1 Tax=Piscirickettsia litoralis TaxID=1891921 RepID=UPI001F3A1603|nr:hypothetical protein [Piscirickettsia litoralis]